MWLCPASPLRTNSEVHVTYVPLFHYWCSEGNPGDEARCCVHVQSWYCNLCELLILSGVHRVDLIGMCLHLHFQIFPAQIDGHLILSDGLATSSLLQSTI